MIAKCEATSKMLTFGGHKMKCYVLLHAIFCIYVVRKSQILKGRRRNLVENNYYET